MGTRTRKVALGVATALGAVAVVLVATDGASVRRGAARDVAAEFSSGARWADSLERWVARQAPAQLTRGDVVAALYLERLRLGVGSPFRLIDYALRDPLLPESARRPLAEAILARASVGAAYATPVEALALLATRQAEGSGLAHRQFMESVTESAESPRAAELALRLAYTVGTASGTVSHRAAAVALGAVAQARDRALAMRDVSALLEEARRQRRDPVDMVPFWRVARRFGVEQPLADPPSADEERQAVALLPVLLARLDSLEPSPVPAATARLLGAGAGAAAAEVVERRGAPPQAPVSVTMGGYASFVAGARGSAQARQARSRFVAQARHEEAMVAELARLRGIVGPAVEPALAVLSASVAMRAYAQERAWLPGDDGPGALELQSRLGLAALSFDSRVPASWRPYYTRMLSEVVSDLQTVFPALDLRGLTVHFGDSPLSDRALALHDPGSRTVYFPLATSAGAMAHELAHDLDWQAARRRYGMRGGYRTDRSARQSSDQLSAAVRRMAGAARPRREALASPVQADRPTEAFARGVDWFVAAALAHRGRVNGYLSSVQDAMITGYASATAPRGGALEADATLEALREIAPVEPSIVTWYDSTYGSARTIGVTDAVRRALVAPLVRVDLREAGAAGLDAFVATPRLLRAGSDASHGWRCLLPADERSRRREVAIVGDAMQLAAGARARGMVQRWGDYARGVPTSALRFRALSGAPWNPALRDSVERDVRDAILWRAARPDDGRTGVDLVERSERRAAWERCATSPRDGD